MTREPLSQGLILTMGGELSGDHVNIHYDDTYTEVSFKLLTEDMLPNTNYSDIFVKFAQDIEQNNNIGNLRAMMFSDSLDFIRVDCSKFDTFFVGFEDEIFEVADEMLNFSEVNVHFYYT